MTDIEKRAKQIVYDVARAVEAWRERNGKKQPVILMPPRVIATVALGAAGVIDVDAARDCGTMLGCRIGLAEEGAERVYLAEEVPVCI